MFIEVKEYGVGCVGVGVGSVTRDSVTVKVGVVCVLLFVSLMMYI